ncbi:MAG: hypothetical protein JW941_05780 [Candidatus Coatesbacteria bacterium]|nr:hypothetical protein [Candidatus Coatesbacteria bacterium]
MNPANLDRYITYAMLVAALFIYAFHSSSIIEYAYDDAFISMRYAENLANGNGLVYNVGERVEGYTNFLWTLILAAVIKLGGDPLIFAKGFGIFFALATMIITFRFANFISGESGWRNALPVLFLACSGPFVAWAQWGLEGGMFTFFAILAIFFFLKSLRTGLTFAYTSILFVIATMTRPEGVIFFAITVAYYFLIAYRGWKLMRRAEKKDGEGEGQDGEKLPKGDLAAQVRLDQLPIRIAQLVAPYVVIYGIYFIWRFTYYGYPYPNTYYVRMAGSFGAYMDQWVRGLKYIFDFTWRGGGAVIVVLVALLWVVNRPRRRSALSFLSIFCIIPIVYSMHVGGDSKHLYRLLMPYLPIFYILVSQSLSWIYRLAVETKPTRRIRRLGTASFIGFVALLMLYTYTFPTLIYFAGGERGIPKWDLLRGRTKAHEAVLGYERQKRLFGEWLREHAPKGTTIATTVAGVTPYYSKLPTYDMLGVTNEHIAHTEPQPNRMVALDIKATGLYRPEGIVENILITSHQKSDNEYIARQNPTIIIEGADIAFKKAGYKPFRLITDKFTQIYYAKKEVQFLK